MGRGSGSGQGWVRDEVSDSRRAGRLSRSRRGSGSHGRTGVRRGKEGGTGKKTGVKAGFRVLRDQQGCWGTDQQNRYRVCRPGVKMRFRWLCWVFARF